MRRNEDKMVRAVLEWKPTVNRPCSRTRKRWISTVEGDLREIGVLEWRMIVHNREELRQLVMAAKTF